LGVVDLPDYVGKLFNIFKTLNIIAEKVITIGSPRNSFLKLIQSFPLKNLLSQNKLSAPIADEEEDVKDENEGVTKKEVLH